MSKIMWSIEGQKIDLSKCARTSSGHYQVVNKENHTFEVREDGTTPAMSIPYLYERPVQVSPIDEDTASLTFPEYEEFDMALFKCEGLDNSLMYYLTSNITNIHIIVEYLVVSETNLNDLPTQFSKLDIISNRGAMKHDILTITPLACIRVEDSRALAAEIFSLKAIMKELVELTESEDSSVDYLKDVYGVSWHCKTGAI